ncbi:HAMP domain-containing sensor histidine kinase [Sulfurimonas sp.]|uniref:sensor histidine kinase n=1 Tax=Sulfurimonas sp. TaxID=2022749 RepID=UPI002B497793|nr:HAMP domain-containing sensor histidine kinase [Sulfurimonas sp.]
MKDSQYSTKYALIYTSFVSVILLAPMFFYFIYMKNIYSIQNKLLLKEKSILVVKAMHEYNQNKEYFEYPRFKTFESGLYDEGFQPIYSLINYKIKYFKDGYHLDGNDAYLIVKLPKGRYFGAKYLIIKNQVSFAVVYEKLMLILFSVVILVFILSLFFLKSFAKPFKKLNKRLDNFIKDSVHEINTPLSIISVNIDLYNRKNSPNKYMQRMKAATKVLSNIYNDMDYLIKHDRLKYEKESINMAIFLKDRIDYFNEVALMKNIIINSNIKNCDNIEMNTKQLQRVIDNTISNAIKYSYENSEIDISLYMKDKKCHLSFKDYGVGIDNVEKIFSRYYREDTSKGGFGIGLNIVKSIISKAKIELKIDSTPKIGSEFLYIFPIISSKNI